MRQPHEAGEAVSVLHRRNGRNGWRARVEDFVKGKWVRYSEAELAWIEGHAQEPRAQAHAADNWVAIPRALLPRLNGRFGRNYDDAPPELKPAILAIAKLEHAAREHRGRKRSGVESAFSPSAKRGDGA